MLSNLLGIKIKTSIQNIRPNPISTENCSIIKESFGLTLKEHNKLFKMPTFIGQKTISQPI